jgi:hypothetical protein
MEMELVSETLELINHLLHPSARENLIQCGSDNYQYETHRPLKRSATSVESRRTWQMFLHIKLYFLSEFAKLRKAAISMMSVRPSSCLSACNNSTLDGFDEIWYLIFFRKSRKNSSFIKTRQEWRVVYINTFSHFVRYIAGFFLEWEMS